MMFDSTRFPRRLSVGFTEAVGAELDAIATQVNVPVAQIVRLCVDHGLPTVREAADALKPGTKTSPDEASDDRGPASAQ